jgi:type II restriction enzyme
MKYLQTYKKLKLKEDEKEIFEYLVETLTDSIFTWDYFVDFEKVKKNIHLIEKELNLLNVLVGKENIEKEFIDLVIDYPNVRKVLPILIAIRNSKLKDLKIIDDFDELKSESKIELFNPNTELTSEMKEDLVTFFKDSGLKNIFQDKDVKNIVDYCFGVEVGMDTNARKNRTGQAMESIVEKIIQKFAEKNNLEYIPQATQKKIKEKWNFDIELDKTNRIFDFAVFEKSKNKIFLIETNYYGGGGSKLKSTAGEYQYLFDFLKTQGIDLIWITDGLGWKTTKKSLFETFLHNDYLLNIELVKQGVLKDIIL